MPCNALPRFMPSKLRAASCLIRWIWPPSRTVRNNGPGIAPELLPKIFQPFFTTKTAREGTGLGLNIVQRLVKEAKGALHVRTRLGEGTTFTLYLPAVSLSAG